MIDHATKVHWDGTKEESGAYLIAGIGPATNIEVPKSNGPWAGGDPSAATIMLPDQIPWKDHGSFRLASLAGDPDKPGLFVQMLTLLKGTNFKPPVRYRDQGRRKGEGGRGKGRARSRKNVVQQWHRVCDAPTLAEFGLPGDSAMLGLHLRWDAGSADGRRSLAAWPPVRWRGLPPARCGGCSHARPDACRQLAQHLAGRTALQIGTNFNTAVLALRGG